MSRIALIFFSLLIFTSCNNSTEKTKEFEKLLIEISNLKKQNKKLANSLKNYQNDELYYQQIIGVPEKSTLKVGEKNRITFIFHKFEGELPNYEIFKVENKIEIKIGEDKKRQFDYEFTPKSIEENELNLKIKMPYEGRVIEFPAAMIFKIEK
jgi:hypothetical protein